MPLWEYYAVFVYPGIGLGMLRAFIEHRWGEKPGQRTAIVESNWVFGLLFLWNNLHIIHHVYPAMPWFDIPRFWRTHRASVLAHNGNYLFTGYGEVARRWLVEAGVHPGTPDAIAPSSTYEWRVVRATTAAAETCVRRMHSNPLRCGERMISPWAFSPGW